jgi:phosphoenolpyruvate carboxykinase (GTP)
MATTVTNNVCCTEELDVVTDEAAAKARQAAAAGGKGPVKHRVRISSMMEASEIVREVDDVMIHEGEIVVHVPVVKGEFTALPVTVQQFVAEYVSICTPKGIYICDGSAEEAEELTEKLVDRGMLVPLAKMDNCYACRTDPADVARVESKTFIVTSDKYSTVPHVRDGCRGILGQWMSFDDMDNEMDARLPGSMTGRVMYIIPFSMGPVGGPLSKIGIQLTDFNYVILSMRIMTRVTPKVFDVLKAQEKVGSEAGEFVRCVHTIGAPRPLKKRVINHWPGDPQRTIIAHYPDERKVISYGSGYGGNSLLGKKCFALRIASCIAKDEGWLAEHMLIMSVTNPSGVEKFIAAAFPSACGKTNMAMMTPSLPGWTVKCVGDDIAWMRFNPEDGRLYAINPEAGFFGVAPGTNRQTNPVALETAQHNTIFTNVGTTDDGAVYWEGLEGEVDPETNVTAWTGEHYKIKDRSSHGPVAHPNSRFCTPAEQCPIIHPRWQDASGVPIDAIVFGGRRPEGVPLVLEAFNWPHGVMLGAALKSEATAAAEHTGRQIMHDPMAMRPFFGYNFGDYLEHWLSMERPGRQLPTIFHVNWFRRSDAGRGRFLWPGFGDNIRVVDWMCRRIDGVEDTAMWSPVGYLPREGSINVDGLEPAIDWAELFSLPKDYWVEDIRETKQFLDEQVGCDLPETIIEQLNEQEARIAAM